MDGTQQVVKKGSWQEGLMTRMAQITGHRRSPGGGEGGWQMVMWLQCHMEENDCWLRPV